METKVFKSGNSLAVRLPKELELPCGPVSIRKEGAKLVIEEITDAASSYISIPSILSIFDEAAAAAVSNVTVDLEGAIDAKVAVECSG